MKFHLMADLKAGCHILYVQVDLFFVKVLRNINCNKELIQEIMELEWLMEDIVLQ